MKEKVETEFQTKYKTDPDFRKKQLKRTKAWQRRNPKRIKKYNANRYKKTKHKRKKHKSKTISRRKKQIESVKKWQKKNPKKMKQYRENAKKGYKTRNKKQVEKRKRYLKKLRRKRQIVKARKKYERKNKGERRIANREHYQRRKKIHVPRIRVFCPKHPNEKLRKMHYVMNQKKNVGIRTTDWHYCRKCKKPYQFEIVQVYKVKE